MAQQSYALKLLWTVYRKFSQYLTGYLGYQSNFNPWIIQTFLLQIGPAKASLWLTQAAAAVKCWRRRRRILLRRMMSDATCGEGYKTPFQLGKRAVVAVKVRGLESIDQACASIHHSLVRCSDTFHWFLWLLHRGKLNTFLVQFTQKYKLWRMQHQMLNNFSYLLSCVKLLYFLQITNGAWMEPHTLFPRHAVGGGGGDTWNRKLSNGMRRRLFGCHAAWGSTISYSFNEFFFVGHQPIW